MRFDIQAPTKTGTPSIRSPSHARIRRDHGLSNDETGARLELSLKLFPFLFQGLVLVEGNPAGEEAPVLAFDVPQQFHRGDGLCIDSEL